MAFDRKKFLEALIGVADPSTPTSPVSTDFAQYFAQNPWGGMNLQTESAALAEKHKNEIHREEGALSKTFGWLMSLGNAVENSILDVKEGDIQDIPRDLAAGVVHAVQPTLETFAVPGVQMPLGDFGTDKVGDFVKKYNTEHEGTGHISGRRLLEEFGANPENDVKNSVSGFAVDVLTDPLTYVGGLGLGVRGVKGAAGIKVGEEAAGTVAETLAKRAATDVEDAARTTLPSNNIPVAAPQALNVPPVPRPPVTPPEITLPPVKTGFTIPEIDKLDYLDDPVRGLAQTQWSEPSRSVLNGKVAVPEGPFHGTPVSFPRDKLRPIFGQKGKSNLYSTGFYTTHDFDVAMSYTVKDAPRRPDGSFDLDKSTIYKAKWTGKNKPNLVDLDAPFSKNGPIVESVRDVVAKLEQEGIHLDDFEKEMLWLKDSKSIRMDPISAGSYLEEAQSSIMQAAVRYLQQNADITQRTSHIDVYEKANKLVEEINKTLHAKGFDGLKHTGGQRVGNKSHPVEIFFDEKKIKLSKAEKVFLGEKTGLDASRSMFGWTEQGGWPLDPANRLQYAIKQVNEKGLSPAAQKVAAITKANEVRLYEKLRPVSVEGLPVPRRTARSGRQESIGRDAGARYAEEMGAPRPITRAELATLQNDIQDEIIEHAVGITTRNTDMKHVMRGMEDELIERGFTFPEGRLSPWLHQSADNTVETFVKGKPLKTRPAIVDDAGEVTMRFGDKYLASKGITPEQVANAVKRIGREVEDGAAPAKYIEPVKGDLKPLTHELAEAQRAAMIEKGYPRLTPVNQANLYQRMWKELTKRYSGDIKISAVQKRMTALKMLREAEDYLIKTHNLKPTYWDGTGLRLSSVIAELEPKVMVGPHMNHILDAWRTQDLSKITDPVAHKAFVDAMARRHLEMGAVAKGIMEGFTKMDEAVRNAVPHYKYIQWKRGQAVPNTKIQAAAAGATTKEATAVENIAKNSTTEQGALTEGGRLLDNATEKEVADSLAGGTKLIDKMRESSVRVLGGTRAIDKDVFAETAADSIAKNIFTWYGMGDMFKTALTHSQALEFWAKQRRAWFANMKGNATSHQQSAAWYEAGNRFKEIKAEVSDPVVLDLSNKIKDYMENLLGAKSLFNEIKVPGGDIASRSGIVMDDLNRHLKATGAFFQFEKGKGGKPWTESWIHADPTVMKQDPASFLYDLDLATHRLLTEYSVIDEFATRFGRVADAEHTARVNHHRITGDLYFKPQQAKEFENLMKFMREGAWHPESPFGKMYVKALRMWKAGVTIYSPSHHIRNIIGDSWLMWMAGHNNPEHFVHSRKILSAQRTRYKDALKDPELEKLQALMNPREASFARAQGSDIILKKHGANVTSDELYGEMIRRGTLPDAMRAEDVFGDHRLFSTLPGQELSGIKKRINEPLGGQAHKRVTKFSEYREHFVRTAHFSAAVEKRITKEVAAKLKKAGNDMDKRSEILKKVYDDANAEVRKWHPDGRDMTQWEQKYARNIVPFYSWQRKAIPLIIEGMLTRPSKVTMYPRATFAAQGALGIEAPGPSDPFPEDQLFPDWMRAGGIGPIGDPESDNAISRFFGNMGRNISDVTGATEGYTVINPGNPFNDTISQLGGMGNDPVESTRKGVGGMLTPAFNIPKEFISDTKFTGKKISKDAGGDGRWPWAAEQIPIASLFQRILELGEEDNEGVDPGPNKEALLNILTGMGIKGSGQYTTSAEFDMKRAIKKILESQQP